MLRLLKSVCFVLLVIASLFACKKDRTEPLFPPLPTNHYELREGQTISPQMGFTVIPDTASVSICPPVASCLIPDNVFASVRVTATGIENKRIRLAGWFGEPPRRGAVYYDSVSVAHRGQLYKIVIKGQYTNKVEGNKGGRVLLHIEQI
jgi:hypothetical protein